MEDKLYNENKNIFSIKFCDDKLKNTETMSIFSNNNEKLESFGDNSIFKENNDFDNFWNQDLKLKRRISKSYNKINVNFFKDKEKTNKNKLIMLRSKSKKKANTSINKYFKNIKQIGKGNFSSVYIGINKINNIEYAIKEIKAKNNNDDIKTIGLWSKLKSKHFLKYYNSWIENDSVYIVLEKCKYSLNHWISKRFKFSENYILKWIIEISSALSLMHRRNFIHFDIKPENILISLENKFKLIDFGLTKNWVDFNLNNIEEGDSRYLDPKILHWEYSIKDLVKTDIFSWGLTVYQLMSGQISLPFNGDDWNSWRNENIKIKINSLDYSKELKNLLIQMLSLIPSERPSSNKLNIIAKNIIKMYK